MFTESSEMPSTTSFSAPGLSGSRIKILTILPICMRPFATTWPSKYMSTFPPDSIDTTPSFLPARWPFDSRYARLAAPAGSTTSLARSSR